MGAAVSGMKMNDIEDTPYGISWIGKRFKTKGPISVTTRRLDDNIRVPLINNSEKSDNTSNLNPTRGNVRITIKKIGLCFTVIGVKRFDSLSCKSPRIYVRFHEDVDIGSDVSISVVDELISHPCEWTPADIENVESPVINGVTLYDSNKLYLSRVFKIELDGFDFSERTPGDNFERDPCEIYENLLEEIE